MKVTRTSADQLRDGVANVWFQGDQIHLASMGISSELTLLDEDSKQHTFGPQT